MKIKQLGLIGYPLEHSFSASYFKKKFRDEKIDSFDYNLYPLDNIKLFPSFLNNYQDIVGLSVTIPYKQSILTYLDEIDESAKDIEAVNTLVIKRKQERISVKGFNTDYIGFEDSLKP
ncbi:MAG: shikimate dehydrogenase, partial [Bacteroidota bacterium]